MPAADDVIWLDVLPSMQKFAPTLMKETAGPAAAAGAASGKSFGKSALKGIAVVAGGAALATKALYNIGSTFDDLADTIRVQTGATGRELDKLVASAKTIGTQIPAQFDKIAPVLGTLNKNLGLTGPLLERVSSQILEYGRLTEDALDPATVTASFKAFKIEGAVAEKTLDGLFRISQDTQVPVSKLLDSVQRGGANFRAFGLDIEQSASLLGTMQQAGLDGDKVVAGLSRAQVQFSKDGVPMRKGLEDTITGIRGFVKSGDRASAIGIATKVFGTRGAAQFVDAVESGKLSVEALSNVTTKSSDTILQAGKDTADFSEQWQEFKNKALVLIEPVAARVFGVIGSGMSWINKNGIPALKGMAKWVGENKTLMVTLGIAVGVTVAGLLIYRGTVATVTAVTKAWNTAQKLLNGTVRLNTIGLIVTALVLLAAGLVLAYKKSDTFRAIVDGAWSGIKVGIAAAWKVIKVVFGALRSGVNKVGDVFAAVKDKIGESWGKLKGLVKGPIDFVIGLINRFIRAVNKIPGVELPLIGGGGSKASGGANTAKRTSGRTTFATGGAVLGSGTGTSDSIPAMLSNGEHVWTAREVAAIGGHGRVEALRAMAKRGVMHFAAGGRVVPGRGNRHDTGYPWASWAGDYPNTTGTPVKAWKSGVVALVRTLAGSYGKHIRMNHNDGTSSLYAHLSRFFVRQGQKVGQGAKIGAVGSTGNSTGPHLHFEAMGGPYTGGGAGSSIWDKITGSVGGLTKWFSSKIQSMLLNKVSVGGMFGKGGITGMLKAVGGQIRDGVKSKLFDSGGWMQPGTGGFNASSRPEPVFSSHQWATLNRAVQPILAGGLTDRAGGGRQLHVIEAEVNDGWIRLLIEDAIDDRRAHDSQIGNMTGVGG